MSKRILTGRLLLLGTLSCSAFKATAQDRVPVQAELVRAIEAGRIHVGDSIFAKVTVKWQGFQCALRQGAVLKGRIVAQSVHSKTQKASEIALLFESGQCDGHNLKPLPLTLAALLAADPNRETNSYEYQPLSEAVGVGIGGSAASGRGNLRSVTASAATIEDSPSRYMGPSAVLPGQVVGIKGVKLNVGSGPGGSSVLAALGHNVRLEAGSQFVLVPNLSAPMPDTASTPPAPTAPLAPVTANSSDATSADDEIAVCLPPQCTEVLTPNETETNAPPASATFSVRDLGYVPVRADQEMYSFDYSSSISYLGSKELLFTFNPHILIRRSGEEARFSKLRVIRAVLINVQEKKVEKSIDWKVPDAQQYLWAIGPDRALVHVGRELRLYGPGLKLEQRLVLNGPLVFLRTSPLSRYFAVGVMQERHSEAVHRQLEEAEDREPEEDVEVRVLDGNLHTLATVVRSSRAPRPVLSDNGEIRVVSASKNRWRIVEDTWDEQKHLLAQLNSTCRPEATTLSPDLVFVVGCDRQSTGRWYRVLRPNGKPILKGRSPSAELEHTASGAATGGSFAIGIAEAAKSIVPESAFRTSDIHNERIAIYRTENGERMFTVNVPAPVPTVQTFVLSPDGNQLAVLRGDQIAFYEMPTPGGRR
jgi:hypothetical protein